MSKMFDTQKELIGWVFGGLSVFVVVTIMSMSAPDPIHWKTVVAVLVTTLGLVSAKALVEIVNAVKGIKGPV